MTPTIIPMEMESAIAMDLPNFLVRYVTNIEVTSALDAEELPGTVVADNDPRVYRVAGQGTKEHTAKVRIDFTITSDAFDTRDFVIINL